jgi:hypothetical protein
MKQVNNICLLVVATSGFASVTSNAFAQDASFALDRAQTTAGRMGERFAPLGKRLGSLVLNASLGAAAEYTSNAKYTQTNAQSDTVLVATPAVSLSSDWGRHAFSIGAKAKANKYSNFDKENTTDWNLFANGRYDISGNTRLMGNLELARGTEGRDSNLSFGNALRPTRTNTATAGVTIESEFNRIRLKGSTNYRKEKFNDVGQVGSVVPIFQHYRDADYLNTTGRIDYAFSPDTAVYLYGAVEKRTYDIAPVANSTGQIYALGTAFNLSALFNGEAEYGTMRQNYKNQGRKESNSYYRANVTWSPTPLTTVTGKLGTSNNEALAFAAFGILSQTASINVDHELLRNMMISASLGHIKDEFRGTVTVPPVTVGGVATTRPMDRLDTHDYISAAAAYYLNGRVSVMTELKHEKLDSSGKDLQRSYKNNIVRVGLVVKY